MKATKRIITGVASLTIVALASFSTVRADTNSVGTYRTTGYFIGLTQGTNPVTGHLKFVDVDFAGHNLVNLAMGRALTSTNTPGQVMAMTFGADLSSASLVVYDLGSSNVVATIATSTFIDSVKQQDTNGKGPNRAHFVAYLQVGANGNSTNGVADGYLTVAGRVNLNPTTGQPQPIIVSLDRDPLDRVVDDIEMPATIDPDSTPLTVRTGLAHLIGVVDTIDNGTTNTVLLPFGGLSIRHELPGTPASTAPVSPAVN
jgi:hypothetical protein